MISYVIIIDKYPLKAQHRHGLWIKLTSLRILSLLKTPFAKLDFEILNFDHLALLEITHFEKYVCVHLFLSILFSVLFGKSIREKV